MKVSPYINLLKPYSVYIDEQGVKWTTRGENDTIVLSSSIGTTETTLVLAEYRERYPHFIISWKLVLDKVSILKEVLQNE